MDRGEQFSNNKNEPLYTDALLDESRFELFFKENFVSLCAKCQYRFGFDTATAKDIVHTAFIKLWESRYKIPKEVPVKNYLSAIIYNSSLDVLKHEKVKYKYQQHILRSDMLNPAESNIDDPDIKQLAADIDKAISELPEKMREIFILSRYKGMKYAAIASSLNISVKTVETQMSRALARLRENLSKYLLMLILPAMINYMVHINFL